MELFIAICKFVFWFVILPLIGFFLGATLFSTLIRGYPTLSFCFGGLVGIGFIAAGLKRRW